MNRQRKMLVRWYLLSVWLLAGCATHRPPSAQGTPQPRIPNTNLQQPWASSAAAAQPSPVIREGARVAAVNAELKFVVLDLGGLRMPALGTRLTVYRTNKPVGSVLLTGPWRGHFVDADILQGEPHAGDEAR